MKLTINQQGNIIALAASVTFTILFCILMAVIKIPEKQVFKEITIQLESTPVVDSEPEPQEIAQGEMVENTTEDFEETVSEMIQQENTEESIVPLDGAPSPLETQAQPVEESSPAAPEEQATVSNTKPAAPDAKPAVEDKTPAPATNPTNTKTPVTPETRKSVDELAKEAQTTSKPKKEFNWDDMDDLPSSSSSTSTERVKATSTSSFEGSAASSASTSSSTATSSSSTSQKTEKKSDVADKSLNEVKQATAQTKTSKTGDLTGQTKYQGAESASGTSIGLSNGVLRTLVQPASPRITLSEESARLIEGSITVKINFSVSASGNVSLSTITFSPASALPPSVQSEISQQISRWRFSEGESGTATLTYSIIKQ